MDTNETVTRPSTARREHDPATRDDRGQRAVSSYGLAITGTLASFDIEGMPLVDLAASSHAEPLRARSCLDLVKADIGKEVVLVFEEGDRSRPLVVGMLRNARPLTLPTPQSVAELDVDGNHVVIEGKDSVTLRCGAASITLRADGKIVIRGGELESRASGLNRILGGSVRIN